MNDLEKRINDLEIKFSYQDELLNELNMIVAKQQKKIDEMLNSLKALSDQAMQGDKSTNEKPPHY